MANLLTGHGHTWQQVGLASAQGASHQPFNEAGKGPGGRTPRAARLLVRFGVIRLLPREAEHATDHAGVLGCPVLVTDLLPGLAVLHLHVALRHGGAFAVGREDGSDPDVLHLDVQVLGRTTQGRTGVTFWSGHGEVTEDQTLPACRGQGAKGDVGDPSSSSHVLQKARRAEVSILLLQELEIRAEE